MKSFLLSCLLALTATVASAQLKQMTLEEAAAKRWTQLNSDRIAADADGHGITLSDIRRQIDPIVGQLRAATRSDAEFEQALQQAAQETLKSMAERQIVIAEFRASATNLPTSYVDGDIEETIRRDFGGDRNRFVASLRAAGTTPLAYRKTIEDRIIFEYMVGQIRRAAWDVNPGKIQEYYDKNKADFVRKEQVKLRQITITQGAAEKPEETAARAAAWAEALRQPAKIPELLARYKVGGKPLAGPASFAPDSPLVSDLREMAFMEAGAIALISGAEARLRLEPLVTQSGAGMGAVPTAAANAGPFEKVALAFKADGKARVVAATVSGNFTSAYPKGAPAPAADEPARPGEPPKAPVAPPAGPHLAASQKPGRLIIVADSDFMMDPFTVRQRQVGGQVATEPVNDNFGFVVSALETLGGSDELVGLRSKGTSLRPFKRVQEIERVAQVRYQAKLDEIERRLEEANAKIAELSRQSGGVTAKGLVITPEMQREIEKFQVEADKLSEERRIIRRGLSEDVNSLGRRLQVLNLLAGPALALLFGLGYALVRRRKLS